MKYIFLHIPKTGGTSFRRSVEQSFSSKLCTYYYSFNRPVEQCEALYGHFRVDEMMEKFPGAKLITFIREPVQQMISNYSHYLRSQSTSFEPGIGILPPNLGFVEFCQFTSNYQSRFLGDIPIEAFDYVGMVENYRGSIEQLNKGLKLTLNPNISKENVATNRYQPTEQELLAIVDYIQKDIELYTKVWEMHNDN